MKLFIFAGTYTDKAIVEGISAALKKAGHCICDEVKDADMIVSLAVTVPF